MDRRSWPWKRRSSDKAAVDKVAAILDSADAALALTRPQTDQENYKKPTYVQISIESYSHLTGLEDQVKTYEEQVQTYEEQVQTYEEQVQILEDKVNELNQKLEDKGKELDEKLSEAESEMTIKESLVKQHAKVAEEAVSGWEKAEAEASALKDHLETITLEKLSTEDRASHLDGALKECMKQIRNLKEEHDRNLHQVILTKTKQWEKIKHEFEAKIVNLDHELKKSASDNDALSRSLQERSNMLVNISEEKSNAEAHVEMLKSNIESCEREIKSLKYELHVAAKELEIRTEEKNMSVKSADVATKQQMEGAKKIAKLEAEVQRLRGLVRKKLPGPAALAQMKMEVDNLGYGESNFRRSPAKSPVHRFSSGPEFSVDALQKFQRETEFLTERLLATEEETKMLKEALSKRNSELQASRSICAKTNSRVQMLEAQLSTQTRSSHHSPSFTSMSEDNDDDRSCAESSYVATSVSEFSPFIKDRSSLKPKKASSPVHLDLMDDFLEMEKLACGSTSNPDADPLVKPDGSNVVEPVTVEASSRLLPLSDLRSRIITIIDSVSEDDVYKALEDIKEAVLDVCNNLQHDCGNCVSEDKTQTKDVDMSQDEVVEANQRMSKDLEAAVLQIHDFVLFLGKEAISGHDISIDSHELDCKINAFSETHKQVLSDGPCWDGFVLDLSRVLSKARELKSNFLGYKESEVNGGDCIDKVALPENKESETSPSSISDVTSHPEVSDDGNIESGDEANVTQNTVSIEEYEKLVRDKDEMEKLLANTVSIEEYEKLVRDKDEMEKLLAESSDSLVSLKSQMQETEKLLAEIQSQLASAQRSKNLGETQLKCMAESYRTLEVRAEELESEVNVLCAKTESLEIELLEEKKHHQEALNRCEDLQEQLQRLEYDLQLQKANADVENNQEKELTAAAQKLAECQETIFLLGKQLNSLRPPPSPKSERSDYTYRHDIDRAVTDPTHHRPGSESPMDLYNFPCSPSETQLSVVPKSPIPKHRSTLSASSSSSVTPEKQSRGFSRFFSSKGKNGH